MASFTNVDRLLARSSKDPYGTNNSMIIKDEDQIGLIMASRSQRQGTVAYNKNDNPFLLEDLKESSAQQSVTARQQLTIKQKNELKELITSPKKVDQNASHNMSVADATNFKINESRKYRLGSIQKKKNMESMIKQSDIQVDLEANNQEEILTLLAQKDLDMLKKELRSMGYSNDQIDKIVATSDKLLTVQECVDLLEADNLGFQTNQKPQLAKQSIKQTLVETKAEIQEGQDLKMCDSCYEEVPQTDFFSLACNHEFCKGCFLEHLETNIKSGKVAKIPCMMHKCEEAFDDESIKKFGSDELCEKYKTFNANMLVDQDPNLKWCPKPDCQKYVRKSEKSDRVICECGEDICFLCGNFWHEGKSCEDAGDKDMAEWMKNAKDLQDCPMCGAKTLRLSGCNRIHCHACKKYRCWLCRGKNVEYSHYEQKDAYFMDNFLGCKEETCRGSVLRGKQQKPIKNIFLMILILIFLPLIVVFKTLGEVLFFSWYIRFREAGDRYLCGTIVFLFTLPCSLIFWVIYCFIGLIMLPCMYVEQVKRICQRCKEKKQK